VKNSAGFFPAALRRSPHLCICILVTLWALAVGLGAQTPPVTIEIPIQSQAYGTVFFEETARLFEKLRPEVRVDLTGSARVHEKLRVRLMAGELPDATDADLLYEKLIANGEVVDLTPYLDGPDWEGTGKWRDRFLPGVLERWTRNGHTYGVPFAHAVWAIFYNKKLFAEHGWVPPKTWNEFFQLCEKMRASGIAPMSLPGVYLRYGDAFLRSAYYNLVGGEGFHRYNELAEGTRNNAAFFRAAEVQQQIALHCLVKGWEGMSHTAAEQAFLEGKAAMTVAGSWLGSEVRGKVPPGFEIGAMNFPVFPDGIAATDTIQAQSSYYFVFRKGDPQREKAAVDFFRYLTSRERVQAFARNNDSGAAATGASVGDFGPAMRDVAGLVARATNSFDAGRPTSAAFLALMEQSMNGLRQELMMGRLSPREYGERLEAAARAERSRAADPTAIRVKHRWAAVLLLALLTVCSGWLLWGAFRRQRGRKGAAQRRSEGFLGRLSLPMATGFVGPALILFLLIVIIPGIRAFVWAFCRWDGIGGQPEWIGLFNFKWLLLESDTFWYALRNNLYIMVVPTLVVVPLSLFLATLIHRGVAGANFFRAVFLFPNLLGGIAATLLWMNAYDPHGGLVNSGLVQLGEWLHSDWLKSFQAYPWLSQDNLYRALIPIYIWMACGFNLVLYLAAMEGIDPELYEAAEIDGAPAWRQFFFITLPLIWDVLAISAVFIVAAGLNTFEMIWLLTSQDPASQSHVLSTLMVGTMFKEFEIGRATAVAVVMFVLVLIGSVVVLRALRRREILRD
jgi:raffinose/stachyose/melibiose transport system permease protein